MELSIPEPLPNARAAVEMVLCRKVAFIECVDFGEIDAADHVDLAVVGDA